MARCWAYVRGSLPCDEILLKAHDIGLLSLVVPWIAEYFKMMEWISADGISADDAAAIAVLRDLQCHPLFALRNERLSGNRLVIISLFLIYSK